MINENSVEDINVKKLMKYLDISFEEYKERFEGTKPLTFIGAVMIGM